ncbi:UNVERIFIED_CONTAM: 5-formyltetrahydrofolate cyclo-ligase, mitochondrial [Sesamum indicum]
MTPLFTFPTHAAPHLPTPTPFLGLNPASSATLTTMSATSTAAAEKDPSLQSQERTQVNGPSAQIQRRQSTLSEQALMHDEIQSIVLEAPWFKSCKRLCAYISCPALREVDTSKVLSEILKNTSQVMFANEPVDLFLLPGLAFDKSGRRLGRGGGSSCVFIMTDFSSHIAFISGAVALSYSVQILEDGIIPVTPKDIPIDALVSSSGIIPITPAADEICS